MALDVSYKQPATPAVERARPSTATGPWSMVRRVLMPLASLKFTIVLFALSIFIVFTGTLAQTQLDVWQVIHGWFRVDMRYLLSSDFPWINFREMFVRIPLNIFCIEMFFPEWAWNGPPPQTNLGIWFPRGWVIGMLMFVNLLAAHTVRFSIQAKGTRLFAGIGVIALGCFATWAAIESGSSSDGILKGAVIEWTTLWKLMLLGLTALTFFSGAAIFLLAPHRTIEKSIAAVTAVLCGGVLMYALMHRGEMLIDPEAIRILWQLTKATGAGLVLLAGCWMVFKKRAGIVLLHGGIGLMFLHEFVVGMWHKEAQMPIFEGTRSNWVQDIRAVELAVIEEGPTEDKVTVIPQRMLESKGVVESNGLKDLPFDVRIVEYFQNSKFRAKGPFEPTKATAGLGTELTIDERPLVTGTDAGKETNLPAMFVELVSKSGDRKSLGTYLLGIEFWLVDWQLGALPPQTVEVDGKKYALEMRHQRTYKPYVIEAREVKQDRYLGGEKTKSYSSLVHVVDASRGVDREELIRMNSPMRFAGETFYQSGYSEAGRKLTTLSVVENSGWMLPYVSCMIVAVGMLAQFGIALSRFLSRQQKPTDELELVDDVKPAAVAPGKGKSKKAFSPVARVEAEAKPKSFGNRYVVIGTVLLCVTLFEAMLVRPPKPDERGMDLAAFGKLPVAYESRVKPIDALARNTLVDLSNRQSFKADYADRNAKSKPAVRWLLDLAAGKIDRDDYQVLRIDNEDIAKSLGLEPASSMTYSWKQILQKSRPAASSPTGEELPELLVQAGQAREKTEKGQKLDASEREAVKIYQRMMLYKAIEASFEDAGAQIPDKKPKDIEAEQAEPRLAGLTTLDHMAKVVKKYVELEQTSKQPPKAVPLEDGSWITVPDATLLRYIEDPARKDEMAAVERQLAFMPDYLKTSLKNLDMEARLARGDSEKLADVEAQRRGFRTMQMSTEKLAKIFQMRDDPKKQLGPAGLKFLAILDAYRAGDAQAFNTNVAEYRAMVVKNPPSEYDAPRRDWEAFLLRSEPFFWNAWMYLIAFCFAAAAWLGYRKPLNRIAFWIIASTFVVHTLALVLRVYVTERPPVTNLYSSAVFIGWAAVLLGLILEAVYKNGFGNVVAAFAGIGSLWIAWLLSRQGDTIESLEAVLDTTFWLATHVTCITLGYATTYIAGLLGAVYILFGVATPSMSYADGKALTRMTYGTLCFAIFFSFVGTVLGGLWADDSWGRFWGWDPKENGALIIVLWNALVLHARWDGMIKDRGLAVMAVFGNITTSWSYFGVNQLGVGLHNYGFNQQLMNLMTGLVVGSLLIAGLGMLPRTAWWSGDKLGQAK